MLNFPQVAHDCTDLQMREYNFEKPAMLSIVHEYKTEDSDHSDGDTTTEDGQYAQEKQLNDEPLLSTQEHLMPVYDQNKDN